MPQLYQSLCGQSIKDFEWLIVDDGSNDDLEEIIREFQSEKKIEIRYIKQDNGGKHRAINRGVKEAKGEFFFIVDSDDYLTPDAVEWISRTGPLLSANDEFAGFSGICSRPDGKIVGGAKDFGIIDSNAIDIRVVYNINGDLAEIFKTAVLRQYPFPDFPNERFCPEALVWYRIARRFKMRYIYQNIYVCDYLPDGLTAKIVKIRRESPRATSTFYSEHFHDNIPLKLKLKAAINFWRFQSGPYYKEYRMLSPLAVAGYLPGKIYRYIDKTKT